MSHINSLQALVIVEHASSLYNLYLSDITGVYFSLSLPDIVLDLAAGLDLEQVDRFESCLYFTVYRVTSVRQSELSP